MFYRVFVLAAAVILSLPGPGLGQDENVALDVNHIRKSVYEVIIPKAPEEGVTYEKPLPMDLIPYAIRNDKYHSIGTAFAVNDTEFMTAAHVMNLGLRKQINEMLLRDGDGRVFPIDQINQFSSRRDFSVFTVKGRISREHLDLNPDSEVNQKVFAVGNALGQGIVIRDGLHTSDTPEEVDGKWNWIRFSAAASPGNSGGPLLDVNGKVIGIVLRKSGNENLNVALPIREAQRDYHHEAEVFDKSIYIIDIFDGDKTGTLDKKVKLPMEYRKFSDQLVSIQIEFWKRLLSELMAENRDTIFPNGDGSRKLLYRNAVANVPQLIVKRADGTWEASSPQVFNHADLGNNGDISFGPIKNSVFMKIQKPDNLPLRDFYSDSKQFMDLILKGVNVPRIIGLEKIRITSLGKADNEYPYSDSYGRKWVVRSWAVPFSDMEVITFSLPVPAGCVTLMRMDQTGRALDMDVLDLKILTDYVFLPFSGTVVQWKEYLDQKEQTPLLFKDVRLGLHDGKFEFRSKRFNFSLNSENLKLNEQSRVTMGLNYFRDRQSVVWDITKLVLTEDKFKSDDQIVITRNVRPLDDRDDKYSDYWKSLLEKKKPYDMTVRVINDHSEIGTVYPGIKPAGEGSAPSVIYDILRIKPGTIDQNEMESGMSRILEKFGMTEDAT